MVVTAFTTSVPVRGPSVGSPSLISATVCPVRATLAPPPPPSSPPPSPRSRQRRRSRMTRHVGVAVEDPAPTRQRSKQQSAITSRPKRHVCSVCVRYADLLLRDVPYGDLPLNLRMKLHFERYQGSSWLIIVVADLLADLSVAQIAQEVHSPVDAVGVVAGFCSAYALADLASGVGNWFTFNFLSNGERACYCDGPGDFARRMAINCAVVLPFLSLLVIHKPGDPFVYSFLVYFLSFVSVIPALVDWSGSRSFPPSIARVLRRIGGLELPSRPSDTAQFLNRAWSTILAEISFWQNMEKWVFLASRGVLVPRAWRLDPEARARAFASDRPTSEQSARPPVPPRLPSAGLQDAEYHPVRSNHPPGSRAESRRPSESLDAE